MDPADLQHVLTTVTTNFASELGKAFPKGQQPGAAGQANAVRPREVLPDTLSDVDPIKWTIFRKSFEKANILNDWEVKRAILILHVSLKDAAARSIQHLSTTGYATLKEALDKMELVFVDPAATDHFNTIFLNSARTPQEELVGWHTRLRETFMRAYPDITDYENSKLLKDRFTLYINDKRISVFLKNVGTYATMTYSELLTKSREFQATLVLTHQVYDNKLSSSRQLNISSISSVDPILQELSSEINSMSLNRATTPAPPGSSTGMKCFHCDSPTHVIRNCRLYTKAIDRVKKNPKAFGIFPQRQQFSSGRQFPQGPQGRPHPYQRDQGQRNTFTRGRSSRPQFRGRPQSNRGRSSFRPSVQSIEPPGADQGQSDHSYFALPQDTGDGLLPNPSHAGNE